MAKPIVSQLGLLTAALLSGCARQPEPQVRPLPMDASPAARYVQLRGTMSLGSAGRSFTPCGSALRFWVAPGKEIDALYPQLTHTQNQPVYTELSARLAPPPEYAADHDGLLKPHQLYHMAAESAGCNRPPLTQSRAHGNEPFWSLSLSHSGARYAQPTGQQHWQLDQHTSEDDNHRYLFTTPSKEAAILAITPPACLDTMAGAFYRWQAELQLPAAQTHRQGCAELVRSDDTASWAGYYRSPELNRMDSTAELRLQPDYRAELRVHFPQSGTERTEYGLWQPLQDNRLQLLLTRQNNQKIDTQITFVVDGGKLVADQQTVNGVIFDYGDVSLTLQRQADDEPAASPQPLRTLPASRHAPQARRDAELHRTLQQYFRDHRSPLTASRYSYVKYDLNQDGFDDALVMFNWCNQDACTLTLFQGGSDGYRFVSRLTDVSTPLQLGREQHYGWQDLLVNTAPSKAAPAWRKLSFDGVAYPYHPQQGDAATLSGEASGVELFSPPLSGNWGRSLAE